MPIERTANCDDREKEPTPPKNSLKDYSEEELIEELESRGYVVSYWR